MVFLNKVYFQWKMKMLSYYKAQEEANDGTAQYSRSTAIRTVVVTEIRFHYTVEES